jgi:cytochrome P450
MDLSVDTTTSPATGLPFSAMPRAPGLPLIGAMPSLLRGRFEFLDRAREQCGDIFLLDLGVTQVVVVSDPLAAEAIFVDRSKNFCKGGGFWEQARAGLGNGLAFSEGELWRRQRRLMNPEFRRAKIAGFRATIERTVDELLAELEPEVARGQAFDVSPWTGRLLATLTVRILFGDSDLDRETFTRLRDALQDVVDGMLAGVVTRSLPAWLPVPGAARFEAARAAIDEIVLGLIGKRRRSGGSDADLLGMLLHAADDEGAMSDQQLRDEIVITYAAGYETTAWALAWGLKELGEHPPLVAELQAELDQGRDPLEFPLLDATFREILRMYPSAPFLPRRAVEDEQLLGYQIPAGTDVVVLPWLVHRNPKYWPEPSRFDPRRHLEPGDRPRMAWMPFGGGQRLCIGMGLAMMEASLALAALLRRFTPIPPQRQSDPRLSATLSSRDGVWIRLAKR